MKEYAKANSTAEAASEGLTVANSVEAIGNWAAHISEAADLAEGLCSRLGCPVPAEPAGTNGECDLPDGLIPIGVQRLAEMRRAHERLGVALHRLARAIG